MQGTVKEFSEETRSGAVLLDDGSELPIPPDAFSRSGLRKLVLGQRVKFEVDAAGAIRSINIATLS
jgi:2-phospho-L-lactate guanylyltransferase